VTDPVKTVPGQILGGSTLVKRQRRFVKTVASREKEFLRKNKDITY